MSVSDLAIVAALVFGWGTLSARLERFDVTAPITFVVAGLLLTHGPLAFLAVAPSNELIKELAEFTLVLILFSDASRVGLHELRADAGLYLRLLGVALPVTIGLGTLLALALFSGGSIWLALLVGAALAPTDAALGAGMMANPAIPARIRRLINVESGLNDGIATPFVSIAIAGAATGGEIAGHGPAAAAAELAVGLLVGVALGGIGGLLVNAARQRAWIAEGFAGSAGLGLAVCTYASALALHGNGFIAAFVGGLAFGTARSRRGEPLVPFVEETGALVSLLVWLTFGAVAVAPAVESLTWQIVLYATLSLTVIRMLPVAVALIGAGLGRATVALVGWFGPRGLASVVFALLALEELGDRTAHTAVAVITITVMISVVAHGATADPVATRYARLLGRQAGGRTDAEVPGIPERRLIRRAVSPRGAGRGGATSAGDGGEQA
ncbi:MAG TPA: cation:proton antiporter [Streptosporangiaceae bacterium]|jgi:NhaP-type Na+/H+ or K+/H+ antiporter|nr:cation:proton antiporter [Streptosporangiaceae bacterium]